MTACREEVPAGLICPVCDRDHQQVNARKQKLSAAIVVVLMVTIAILFYFRRDIADKRRLNRELADWKDRMKDHLDA